MGNEKVSAPDGWRKARTAVCPGSTVTVMSSGPPPSAPRVRDVAAGWTIASSATCAPGPRNSEGIPASEGAPLSGVDEPVLSEPLTVRRTCHPGELSWIGIRATGYTDATENTRNTER